MTWTEIYESTFGPSGTSPCSANGGCHTKTLFGFKCGTTKATCYQGLVAAGLVTVGPDAATSPLVDPALSPLCGKLGGSMPKDGVCVTEGQLMAIGAWLAEGAKNN